MSKWILKKLDVLLKSSEFHVVSLAYDIRNIWRDFRLPMSALATVARKSFSDKFTAKIDFPIGHFMLPLLMLTL